MKNLSPAPMPRNAISALRNLYDQVATCLNLDSEFVRSVARGECRSLKIEGALEQELRNIAKTFHLEAGKDSQHKAGRNRSIHKSGAQRRSRTASGDSTLRSR